MCVLTYTSKKKRLKNGQLICIVWDLVVWEHENKVWCIYMLKYENDKTSNLWLVYLWRGKRKWIEYLLTCYLIKKHQTWEKFGFIRLSDGHSPHILLYVYE